MRVTIVKVPDGADWGITVERCHNWIRHTWPDLVEGQHQLTGEDGDWGFSLGLRESSWWFTNASHAIMFKLACGGK